MSDRTKKVGTALPPSQGLTACGSAKGDQGYGATSRSRPDLRGSEVGTALRSRPENHGGFGETRPTCSASLPDRKKLPHDIPPWVEEGAVFFITICTSPRGVNQLCHTETSEKIWKSALFYQSAHKVWIHLFLLMPDHVYCLMNFPIESGMKSVIKSWKRFTTSEYGIKWQRDFFDHRLRNNESYEEKAAYIRKNPVRAKLVESSEDWPYIWTARDCIAMDGKDLRGSEVGTALRSRPENHGGFGETRPT